MLKRIGCLFSRHEINRHRVWHDGIDFRTRCVNCDRQMVRTEKGWRAFDPYAHADARRSETREAAQQ